MNLFLFLLTFFFVEDSELAEAIRDSTPEITLDNILPMDKKERDGEREKFLCPCEYVKGMDSVPGDFEITDQAVYFRNLETMVSHSLLYLVHVV